MVIVSCCRDATIETFKSKREARIVRCSKDASTPYGRLREQAGVKFVTPEDDRFLHEILIPDDQLHGAQFGQFVVVQLDTFPESNRQPVGHVVDVVGAASDPGLRYKSLYERMICHMSFLRRRLLRHARLVIPLIQQSLICEWI